MKPLLSISGLLIATVIWGASAMHGAVAGSGPRGEGTRAFVARPKFGAAEFNLPSVVRWHSSTVAGGAFRVALNADVNVQSVLANVRALSAKALDRNTPCGDIVRVQSAAAKLMATRAMKYDVRFRFVKRVCAGSIPVELPADVTCSAKIALSALRSIITIDVQGAIAPPCQIVGAYAGVSDAIYTIVGIDVFKRHTIDLAKILPKEFQGVTVDIRTLAFDLPPAAATLHIAGESTMSQAQFMALMARLDAAAPATN